MDFNQYLSSYGISANALSQTQKDGLEKIWRSAGWAALGELNKILEKEANKYKNGGTVPNEKADEVASNAQKAFEDAQADAEKQAARKKALTRLAFIAGGVLVAVGVGVFIWIKRKKRNG